MARSRPPKRFPFIEAKMLRRAAVVCHRHADADAYLSAFALSKLLRTLVPRCRVDIVTPDGMTTLTRALSTTFRHRIVDEGGGEYDLYVAVDVGESELLKGWREKMESSPGVKVLVDHHPLRNRTLYDHVLVDENATSAAEVVFGLFRRSKVPIDRRTAQALLEGILFDSSHLAIAGEDALRAAVHLIEKGADLPSARRALRSKPDFGEVMAKLKGAQRLRVHRLGDWVVATTLVRSFHGHVARSLLYLGADVSVVAAARMRRQGSALGQASASSRRQTCG
jgi:nanoRNase/pAp phosphatase (c-di-AMP/oligoRNAs hydrolase)